MISPSVTDTIARVDAVARVVEPYAERVAAVRSVVDPITRVRDALAHGHMSRMTPDELARFRRDASFARLEYVRHA